MQNQESKEVNVSNRALAVLAIGSLVLLTIFSGPTKTFFGGMFFGSLLLVASLAANKIRVKLDKKATEEKMEMVA